LYPCGVEEAEVSRCRPALKYGGRRLDPWKLTSSTRAEGP
jgi:hypothetical protein